MLASPFAFLRCPAVVIDADLARKPTTRVLVVLCGDTQLNILGIFASPERRLTFDIDDFDETYLGLDYKALLKEVDSGRISAEMGV